MSEVTTTVEEVRQTAQLSSDKANEVSTQAEEAAETSENGKMATDDSIAGMRHIKEEVKAIASDLDVDVVLFDDELLPRHQRELEKEFGEEMRVLDRTALILDIFALHADTREGKLQVELAQLEYRLPRLTRMWTHLARQAGGRAGGSVGGGGHLLDYFPGLHQCSGDYRPHSLHRHPFAFCQTGGVIVGELSGRGRATAERIAGFD